MDVITYALARKYADKIAATFAGGLKYQGSKQTVTDLPAASSSNKGHMYTVVENGHEYVSDGTQWIDLSADLANKADKTELQAEANLREAADEVLQTNIDTEETARTNADALLQGNIDSEVTTRTNADIALNNAITTEVNARETAINNVNESINQEAITREQADLTLQNNISAKQDIISDLATIRSGAALGATSLQEHQDISGKLNVLPTVEDPEDPGYGYPYWIPYSFATTPKVDGLDVTLKTLTLDNTLRKMNFTNAFPVASSSQAGIMTAADKVKLDSAAADADVVKITGDQDISGSKTFKSPIIYSDGLNYTKLDQKKIVIGGAMMDATTFNLPDDLMPGDTATLATQAWTEDKISGKQDTLTAGTGIDITNNIISLDSDASIAIYDNRIDDADNWLTNGYTKTSAEIPTANLPAVCTGNDRWGVLLYVAENNANHAGLQQYFPINGTYKGRVFYRSVTGYNETTPPYFGEWNLVPWDSEKQDKLTAGTNISIDENNVISATGSGSSYTAETPIEITDNTIKHKEYFSRDSYGFGIVYYDKYGHITTVNGQEVTGGLLHQANKITVNTGKGLEVDSDSNQLKAVGVEYKNNETVQSNALKFVKLAKNQYEALATKDPDTLYIIIG